MHFIEETYEVALEKVTATVENYNFNNLTHYKWWLSQTFYFVSHSTKLLALAAAHCEVNNPHHVRFCQHIAEESAHERLLLDDLGSLNTKPEEYQELAPTMALYQSQYYYIQHHSPLALYGYILLLEGIASRLGPSMHTLLEDRFGANATKFIKVHALEDQDHIVKALEMVSTLNDKDLNLISKNLNNSAYYYTNMLTESALRISQ